MSHQNPIWISWTQEHVGTEKAAEADVQEVKTELPRKMQVLKAICLLMMPGNLTDIVIDQIIIGEPLDIGQG